MTTKVDIKFDGDDVDVIIHQVIYIAVFDAKKDQLI